MNTVAELFESTKGQAGSAGVCNIADWMVRANVVGPEILDLDVPIQAWLCGTPLGFRSEFWLGRLAGDIQFDLSQEVPWKEIVDDGRMAYTQVFPVPATINDVYEAVARSEADHGKEMTIRYANTSGRQIVHTFPLRGNHTASTPTQTGISDVVFVSKPRTTGAVVDAQPGFGQPDAGGGLRRSR